MTWEDLQCGEAINVYGRHLLLMACDSSTKEWYGRRGVKQRTLTVSHGEVEVRAKQKNTPVVLYRSRFGSVQQKRRGETTDIVC